MFTLIHTLFTNPVQGILTMFGIVILYIWREQGKIKTDMEKVEKGLDDKKLDKEDHESYAKMHKELHAETHRQTNIILKLLGDSNRR